MGRCPGEHPVGGYWRAVLDHAPYSYANRKWDLVSESFVNWSWSSVIDLDQSGGFDKCRQYVMSRFPSGRNAATTVVRYDHRACQRKPRSVHFLQALYLRDDGRTFARVGSSMKKRRSRPQRYNRT